MSKQRTMVAAIARKEEIYRKLQQLRHQRKDINARLKKLKREWTEVILEIGNIAKGARANAS